MNRFFVVLAIALSAAGCSSAGEDADDDVRSWARQIRFLEPAQLGDRSYDELAAIEEDAAISASGEEAAVDRAKDAMRLRAAKVDADAVVIVQCGRVVDPDDPATRFTPTVRCQGVAIRWKTP
jgi:hypothetical protein